MSIRPSVSQTRIGIETKREITTRKKTRKNIYKNVYEQITKRERKFFSHVNPCHQFHRFPSLREEEKTFYNGETDMRKSISALFC